MARVKNGEVIGFVDPAKKTARYHRAISALQELAEHEGWDQADRAYSEAVFQHNEQLLREWYGSPQSRPITTFLGRQSRSQHSLPLRFPAADHCLYWKKRGGTATYTSEPYEIGLKGLRELVAFCDQHQLDCCISTGSRHFPSSCVLVRIQHKDSQPCEIQWRPSDRASAP